VGSVEREMSGGFVVGEACVVVVERENVPTARSRRDAMPANINTAVFVCLFVFQTKTCFEDNKDASSLVLAWYMHMGLQKFRAPGEGGGAPAPPHCPN
jgi:hypothetical protein